MKYLMMDDEGFTNMVEGDYITLEWWTLKSWPFNTQKRIAVNDSSLNFVHPRALAGASWKQRKKKVSLAGWFIDNSSCL